MFAMIAATIFFAAFLLATATILGMFALYRDKMIAALLFEPIPREAPVYRLRVSRRRAAPRGSSGMRPVPASAFAA